MANIWSEFKVSDETNNTFSCFQDIPIIPTAVVVVMFALLRMAEICKSPFHHSVYYDLNIREEIDVQVFIGSMFLCEDNPPSPPPSDSVQNTYR